MGGPTLVSTYYIGPFGLRSIAYFTFDLFVFLCLYTLFAGFLAYFRSYLVVLYLILYSTKKQNESKLKPCLLRGKVLISQDLILMIIFVLLLIVSKL